jgi:hypothetical protein
VLTNSDDVNHGRGGDEVLALLEPDHVAAPYDLTVVGESLVTERRCLRVAARDREGVTEGERYEARADPFGMIAGGEDFVLDVDSATGLLMRATTLVDAPLDDALFAPLAEA